MSVIFLIAFTFIVVIMIYLDMSVCSCLCGVVVRALTIDPVGAGSNKGFSVSSFLFFKQFQNGPIDGVSSLGR